eukprot:3957487-Amphidinium_carterae.1
MKLLPQARMVASMIASIAHPSIFVGPSLYPSQKRAEHGGLHCEARRVVNLKVFGPATKLLCQQITSAHL